MFIIRCLCKIYLKKANPSFKRRTGFVICIENFWKNMKEIEHLLLGKGTGNLDKEIII